MELQVADNPERAQFEIRADGELAGVVQYHLRDGVIAFLHAETDSRFRGQGVVGRSSSPASLVPDHKRPGSGL